MSKKKNLKHASFSDVKLTDAEIKKFAKKHTVFSKGKVIASVIGGVALVGAGVGSAVYFGVNRGGTGSSEKVSDKLVVSFDSNGGTFVNPVQVEKGKKISAPENPTKSNSEYFQYWYAESENTPFNFNTPITGNITLHAKWGIKITDKGLIYELNDDGETYGVYASKSYIGLPTKIKIPEEYEGKKVTLIKNTMDPNGAMSIGDVYGAFQNTFIEEIELPDTITAIEQDAFNGCKALKKIKVPGNCVYIGNGAFNGCENLKKIDFNKTLSIIGDGAFQNCSSLEKITFPSSLTSLGQNTFGGCSSLTEVDFNNCNISKIGYCCFENCVNLDKINIPTSVISIDSRAFENCKLTHLVTNDAYSLWEKPETDPIEYFENDTELAQYLKAEYTEEVYKGSISDTDFVLTYTGKIGNDNVCSLALSERFEGGTVDVPESIRIQYNNLEVNLKVTSISDYGFAENYNIITVNLPNSLERIGNNAFYGCSNLTTIKFGSSSENDTDISLKSIGSNAFTQTILNKFNSDNDGNIILPEGLTTLGNNAFTIHNHNEYNIKYLQIPKSLTLADFYGYSKDNYGYITPNNPFYGIIFAQDSETNYISVDQENSLITADDNGIYTADGKTLLLALCKYDPNNSYSYAASEGVEKISYLSFFNYTYINSENRLVKLTLSNSINAIESGSLRIVNDIESNSNFTIDNQIVYKNNDNNEPEIAITTFGENALNNISTPSTVTKLGKNCFRYLPQNTNAVSITLNDGLKEIADGALPKRNIILSSLTIPSSVESLGNNIFGTSLLGDLTVMIHSTNIMNLETNSSRLFGGTYIYISTTIVSSLNSNSYIYNNYKLNEIIGEYTSYKLID